MAAQWSGRMRAAVALSLLILAAPGRARARSSESRVSARFLDVLAAPGEAASSVLERNLRLRQAGFLARLRESDPSRAGPTARQDAPVIRQWRDAALEGQAGVVLDALSDSLLEHYQVRRLGREAGLLLRDPAEWDAGTLAAGMVVGGCVTYLNGVRASGRIGPLKAGLSLQPGLALRRGLSRGGEAPGLARLELSPAGSPLTLAAQWGAVGGSLRGEHYGLQYRLGF